VITLAEVLEKFFKVIDPTILNRQGNDIGTQYRTGIYYMDEADIPAITAFIDSKRENYKKPIVTEVLPLKNFYDAEEYHQDYLKKNPRGYCHIDLNTD
jgi:peptide-methionine (S)-S-oxide reductase